MITIDNYYVLWNPFPQGTIFKAGEILITELGLDSKEFSFSGGMCWVHRRSLPRAVNIALMMIDFHTIVVRDKLDPQRVHKEFLKIREYRQLIALDIEGAEEQEEGDIFQEPRRKK